MSSFAFLSYSSQDVEFARTFARDLKNAGVRIWFADTDPNNSDIPPGDDWDRAVEKALSDCDCLVVLLSPEAVDSRNVNDEFGLVLDRGKKVFPVVYLSCAVPSRLSRIQRVDFQADYKAGLGKLLTALIAVLTAAPPPPSAPLPVQATFSEAELNDAGQAIAWESLRARFWPEPVAGDVAIEVIRGQNLNRRQQRDPSLQDSQKMSQDTARQLIDRLAAAEFLRRLPNGSLEIVKPSDAMNSAAYLQVDQFGADRSFWDRLLSDARQKLQAAPDEDRRGTIVEFLVALRKVGKLRADELKIPHAVVEELDHLIDRTPLAEIQEYFANFVRRWGTPEGIGRIQPGDVPHGQSVRFTRRNGRVIRLESVNGSGALIPSQRSSLSYLGRDSATPEQTECRWEFTYDESGRVALEEASDSAGRLLYRCAYSPSPSVKTDTGQRETTARYFIDNSDIVRPRTRSGASFVRISRDEAGFDQRFEYLDGLGLRQADELGRFGQQFENGPLGLPVRVTCLGPDLSPAPCRRGYGVTAVTYDERGNPTSQNYLNCSNQPVPHADGYHKATFAWDARGNWTQVRLLDVDGAAAIFARDGFSGWDATYDDAGNQTGQIYLDAQGNPAPIQAGYARWTGIYDSRGKLVDQTYLDPLGLPVPSRDGIVRTVYQFDTGGNVLEVEYRDAAGHPAADSQGIARFTSQSDERGQATAGFSFGLDGQPTRNKDGYAGFQATYDSRGNQTEFIFLGPDGLPDWAKLGYARQKLRYDARGNIIEELFFSPSGEPTEDNDGVHRKLHVYDEHANLVSTRRFNAVGQPAVVDGYSITTQVYDAVSGNAIRKEYRDPSGGLTFNCDGYAIELLGYDSWCRQIKSVYLDPAEKPVLRAEGYVGWEALYDARGLAIARCNLDAEGRPCAARNGVSCWRAAYDARGNRTLISYVDPQGHPALNARGAATIIYTYGPRGNRTGEGYFGLDGKPVALDTGVAGILWKYDTRNNPVEQTYIDPAGYRVVHPDGYASWSAAYDARGNCISREFIGAQGQFVANKDGFVRILKEYDDRNRPVRERKFTLKKEGQPEEVYETLTKYEFLIGREEIFRSPRRQIVSRFNRFGRQIAESWFQPDGSPETTRENEIAFARWEASYGVCGRLARRVYFDGANEVVCDLQLAYDETGEETGRLVQNREDQLWRIEKRTVSPQARTVEVALMSSDRKTPLSDPAGRARWIERYDGRDNRIDAAYFDVDGASTPYHGHLRTTAVYDSTSRLIKSVYLIPFGGSDTLQKSFDFAPGQLPVLRFESIGPDGKNQGNEAFVLEYRMQPNDICHYSMTLDLGPGQEKTVHMSQTCTAVNPDGTFEISVEAGDPPQIVTMTMARCGKMLRTSLREPISQTSFPTHPVFIGERWPQPMPFPLLNPFTEQHWTVPLTYNHVLADVAPLDGRRVARIQVQIPKTVVGIGSEVTVTIEGSGETLFDIEQGLQLSSKVSSHITYAVPNDVVESRTSVSLHREL